MCNPSLTHQKLSYFSLSIWSTQVLLEQHPVLCIFSYSIDPTKHCFFYSGWHHNWSPNHIIISPHKPDAISHCKKRWFRSFPQACTWNNWHVIFFFLKFSIIKITLLQLTERKGTPLRCTRDKHVCMKS